MEGSAPGTLPGAQRAGKERVWHGSDPRGEPVARLGERAALKSSLCLQLPAVSEGWKDQEPRRVHRRMNNLFQRRFWVFFYFLTPVFFSLSLFLKLCILFRPLIWAWFISLSRSWWTTGAFSREKKKKNPPSKSFSSSVHPSLLSPRPRY